MSDQPSNIGADLYFGTVHQPQPDWRQGDPDDEIDDNDDPRPIDDQVLWEMLGFHPDELERID